MLQPCDHQAFHITRKAPKLDDHRNPYDRLAQENALLMRPVRVMMFALAAPAAGIVFVPPGLHARSLRTPAPTAAATFRTTAPRRFENNNAYANENMQALRTPTSFKRGPRSLLDNMARTCGNSLKRIKSASEQSLASCFLSSVIILLRGDRMQLLSE